MRTSNNIGDKSYERPTPPVVNDSLERIGHSLQKLIDQAEASLLATDNCEKNKPYPYRRYASPTRIISHYTDQTKSLADYSHRRIQQGYAQSQERLTAVIEQLEQSIQTMLYSKKQDSKDGTPEKLNSVMHYHHHHHHYIDQETKKGRTCSKSKTGCPKPLPKKRNNRWPISFAITMLMLGYIGYISFCHSRQNQYDNLCLTIIFLLALYRKRNTKRRFPVINMVDKFVIQLVFSKETTPMLGFLHRFNILYHCITRLALK